MTKLAPVLLKAVDLALAGDWQGAHAIAQDHEDEPLANWLHAVAHWMEGDLDNARYWFGRAGRKMDSHPTAEATLRAIRGALEE